LQDFLFYKLGVLQAETPSRKASKLVIVGLYSMAKQAGDVFIEGSFDNLSFYKMGKVYYMRKKSPLMGSDSGRINYLRGPAELQQQVCRRK